MLDQSLFNETNATESGDEDVSALEREFDWTHQVWQPAGTVLAVALTLLLTWHVIHGKHGLSVWRQKQAEDRALRQEIGELERENARLKQHVERLKTDPNAIEHEAREKLHYARPGEIIYTLPPDPPVQIQAAVQTERPTVLDLISRAVGEFFRKIAHFFSGGVSAG